MANTPSPAELIHSVVSKQNPESILQIGLSSLDIMKAICTATASNESNVITLIEPLLYERPENNAILEQLKNENLHQTIDFMATSADQVLPDLYFQELSFDLAIMNPCATYEETFVTFYYLHKMFALRCQRQYRYR